jgi:ABC-2 type transport system permease protein
VAELIWALWRRDMVKFLRDRQNIVAGLARPFLWLVALGFGLRGSIGAGAHGAVGGHGFISFLVPGLAAMSVLFASMFAAISIVWDREFGFLKELLVAPVPRSSIVIAKMLAGSSMGVFEAAIMMALAPLLGARFDPVGAAAGLVLLLPFGMAVNALGVAIAAGMKSFEGFGGIVNFIIQPIFFLSGAIYPLEGLPHPLRIVVLANPMFYVVDAVRGLSVGPHHFAYAIDVGVVLATAIALAALATRRFAQMRV